jgi:small subunit ribosomal protein S6
MTIRRYIKMEEKLCSYETLFVVDPRLSEEDTKAVIEKFTAIIAADGTVEAVKESGKRRLAYPINKVNEGCYVLVTFTSAPEFPDELDRLFGINDAILRSMTLKLEKAPEAAKEEAAPAEEAAE